MMRNYLTGLIAKTLSNLSLPLSHCIKSSTVPQKFFHSAAPASDHHWWWRAVNLRRKARREPVSLIGNYILYVHPGKCFLLPNVYKTPKPMTKPVSPVSQSVPRRSKNDYKRRDQIFAKHFFFFRSPSKSQAISLCTQIIFPGQSKYRTRSSFKSDRWF